MTENLSHIPKLLLLLFSSKETSPNYLSYILRTYHTFLMEPNKSLPDLHQIRLMLLQNYLQPEQQQTLIQLETLLQKFSKQRIITNKNSILLLLYLLSNPKYNEFSLQTIFPTPEKSIIIKRPTPPPVIKNQLSDAIIIKDLIFVLQGLDGSFLKYNRSHKQYEFTPNNRSIISFKSKSQEILTYKLSETGFLFKRITSEIAQIQAINTKKSLIKTYFIELISQETNRFYTIVNSLESQLSLSEKMPCKPLSLKSLIIMINQEHERLKWVNILWDSAINSGYMGCQILNAIYQFYLTADSVQKLFFYQLLSHIIKPLFVYITHWISFGEIKDNYLEFFIEENNEVIKKTVKNEENVVKFNFWQDKFTINIEKTPSFWSFSMINRILTCGKTAYFLRFLCRKYDFQVSSNIFPFDSNWTSGFETWLNDKLIQLNSQLKITLFNEFLFIEELHLLKGYLLMGDGFFIDLLLNELKDELKKPCNQIYRHIMMGKLEKTLKKTVQKAKIRKQLLERLNIIYIKRSSIIDIGWDLFSLDLNFTEPLNQLITENERNIYSKIFNFLIKIKKFQLEIQDIWKKTLLIRRLMLRRGFSEKKIKEKETFRLLKQAEITRNLIGFFLNNFLEFLLIEGIESEWNSFELNDLKKCESIDEILKAHSSFLNKLQRKFMLYPENQPIINIIQQLFEHIKAFVIINNSILDDLQRFLLKMNDSLMKNMQEIVCEDESEAIIFENQVEDSMNIFKELESKLRFPKSIIKIKNEFESTLTEFLILLEKNQIKTTLAFKLNYNEFLDVKLMEFAGNKKADFHYLNFKEIGELLSPVKVLNQKIKKRNSSPDLKKIFLRAFEEEDDVDRVKDDNYIDVFNDSLG